MLDRPRFAYNSTFDVTKKPFETSFARARHRPVHIATPGAVVTRIRQARIRRSSGTAFDLCVREQKGDTDKIHFVVHSSYAHEPRLFDENARNKTTVF